MQRRVALAAAALLPLASAFQITITSNCPYTVYGWNVVDNYGTGSPTFTLGAGGSNTWSGPFMQKTNTGGPSMKLQKVNSLFENALQTQIEYDMSGSTLFYDVSNINGFPFSGDGLTMSTSNSACPTVNCPAGEAVCSQAYNQPDDLRTLACAGGADIVVTLCGASTGSSGSSSSSSTTAKPSVAAAAAPSPAPTTLSTTPAPSPKPTPAQQQGSGGFLQESPEGDVEVIVQTIIATATSTVVIPAPSGNSDKRDAHLHQHLHRGHSRVMGRHAH